LNVKDDCSNYDELPDLSIILNDKEFKMKPSDYVLKTKDDGNFDEDID